MSAPSPIDTTQRALAAFHCGACHERSGADFPEALNSYFKCKVETDLGDEGRLPPRLDGTGSRLKSSWLERVIANGERARPYLAARMPRFGADVAAHFVDGLAAIEGEWRSDREGAAAPIVDEALAIAGRKLAGSSGLNCITCHSFGNRPSAGTPGLDFLQFAQRLREEPWRSYALSPLRSKPGTRMPTFFEDGKSSAIAILDGDADRQIDALWAWFQKANAMPAPDGVPTGQRMVLDVGERPKVFRTFLERAGSRGIAVGDPTGLHFAFDAEQIRLCEAWSGEFLDVAPVWTARGGHVAPQLGPVVWSAPQGPALLLEKPEGAWPTDSGRNHGLKFGGYRLEPDGRPVFLWDLRPKGTPPDEPSGPGAVHVEESFVPDPRAEVLFVRTFRVTNLAAETWLYLSLESPFFRVSASAKSGTKLGTDSVNRINRVALLRSEETLEIRVEVSP